MSFLTKLLGNGKQKLNLQGSKICEGKPESKPEGTETTLRKPVEASASTKRKEGPELTAVEMANKQDWEVKSLPVWSPGEVILDTYEVEDVISGGMGHVYIANHKNWNLKLAIKSPNEMMLSDRSNFARILREASSWTELGLHPNIAYCYYVRNIEEVPHIFVEYVDGGNLRQWIEDGKCIDYRTSLDLAIQFCHGMEYAHSKGMIHRDIKPENILMTQDGILKITDFGLVRGGDTGPEADQSDQRGTKVEDSSLTVVGAEMGTWGYMSPEQKENPHVVDERTDIFSFGICLYEMFCGNRPYEITFGPMQEPPDLVSLSGDENFPAKIEAILTKAVQWGPAERYKNFSEIRHAFSRIYYDLFEEESPYAELELLDLEADGLNNQGVSYFDMGKKEDATTCWEKALKINQLHPEATYNLSMVLWRDAKIDDLEVLRRLSNCANNPSVEKEKLAKLKSFIHAEKLDFNAAKEALQTLPGRYEALFSGRDTDQIRLIQTMEGHTHTVNAVAVTPCGKYAVSGSSDQTIRMWELESGRCVHTMEGHTSGVQSIALSADGQYAVSGSWHWDSTVRVWKLDSGRCVRILEGHTGNVYSVAVSPDGRFAVSASDDKTIKLWDIETGRCAHTMEGHTTFVRSVTFGRDGQRAISGSYDGILKVWDIETGQCIHTLKGHTDYVSSVTITSDGQFAVSGGGGTLKFWDIDTGQCMRSKQMRGISSLVFTPDGQYAVSSGYYIRFWDINSGRCACSLKGHPDIITSVAITPDGRHAVTAGNDKMLRIWKIAFGNFYHAEFMLSHPKGFKERKAEKDAIDHAVMQAENLYNERNYKRSYSVLYDAWKDVGFSDRAPVKRLYTILKEKGRIKDLSLFYKKAEMGGHSDRISSISYSSDAKCAVTASRDKTLGVWNIETGQCMHILKGHTEPVRSVTITSDGQHAISAGDDKTLRMWDLETGRCVRTMKGHSSCVRSVAVTPGGRYLVSGGDEMILRVWEVETGRCIRTLEGHRKKVYSIASTPDGKHTVSAGWDGTVRVWDLQSGNCIHTMKGHTGFIRMVKVTPDGRYAVSASHDHTLRVWDIRTGQSVNTLKGHTNWVMSVTITPDGRYAVSYCSGDSPRVWDLSSGRCIRTLEGLFTFYFSPDSSSALSGSYANLEVWELIWDLEFPDPVDWDEGVRPYLEIFLTLRNGKWSEEDFQELITELAEKRGYGWVRPEGIRKELERMTKDYRS